MLTALQKLLHFIYMSYALDDFFLNDDFSEKDLLANAEVVWELRPAWDDSYDFHS